MMNRARDFRHRINPTKRKMYLTCFCSEPGKFWMTARDPHVEICVRHFVACSQGKCCFFEWIDESWINEEEINLTQHVRPYRIERKAETEVSVTHVIVNFIAQLSKSGVESTKSW